ncbi:hypothetical protein NGRA_0223 [Nosema granulosis]|uniref:Uncharacterized protein n=1 Tax=Nosema granulosis TaxID=83296 RepID=A0A9P6H406_9MICR|nr:hypothetical protein NGRA_0223 [Nosema granulosis]
MKNNLTEIFNLSELKKFIFKRDNLKAEYCTAILERRFQDCSKNGLKLFDACPAYLLLSYFLQLYEDRKNKNMYKLLEILLEKQPITTDIALLLAKEDMFTEVAIKFLDTSSVKDYIYQIIKKELMIRDRLPFEEDIIDELDDWDLYEYALSHNIDIKKRETINFKYYSLHNPEGEHFEESREYLLKRIRIYKDLKYISELCKIYSHNDYVTDCLLGFIKEGFKLEKAKEIYSFFLENQAKKFNALENGTPKETTVDISDKFNLLKCLLGHLIASRDISLLILALYLTFSHRKDFPSNYEISLIHLFLCRFFCFYKPIESLFKEFDVKNNQKFNLSFVWSDMLITLGIQDKSRVEDYRNLLQENIKIIEKSIKHFIEKGKFLHTISLMKVHAKLKDDIVDRELKASRILSTSSETIFSDLLGLECSYLFDKQTVESSARDFKNGDKKLISLFGDIYPYENVDDLFLNPVRDVKDETFEDWFKYNLSIFQCQ